MNKLVLPILALSIIVGASPFLVSEFLVEEKTQFEQNVTAKVISEEIKDNGTRVGVNPGSNLDFGEIETGIKVTKYLNYNSSGRERVVEVDITGNVTEKLNATDSQFVKGKTQIPISFLSEETGYYSGKLSLKTLTPRRDLGQKWLELRSHFY